MNSTLLKQGFNAGVIVFAVASLIAIPLRTVQYFTVIEAETGFYSEKSFSVYLFAAVIIAAIVLFGLLGFAKRKSLCYSTAPEKRAGFGALAGLSAAGFVFDVFGCLEELGSDKYEMIEYAYQSEEVSALATAATLTKVQLVFAAVSAFYFLILCLCNLIGKAVPKAFCLFSLSPVIWGIAKLVLRFTRTISYIQVSDLMLEMLSLVFVVMFFMAFAQLEFGVSDKGCEWRIAFYGLSASVLLLLCFIPRFIVTVSGNPELVYSMSKVEYSDICLALFTLCAVVTRLSDKKAQNDESEKVEAEV